MKNKNTRVSDRRFILLSLLTISGFLIAAVINAAVRQIADVKINTYTYGSITLSINEAYRIVLFVIAFIYAVLAVRAFLSRKRDARQKYVNAAAFRFVLGIALAAWDILGTKMLILPQPFFPGPARIIEAFLMESGFILKNTLYSLRLYAAGFSLGVIFGVGTGIVIGWFPKVRYWVYPILRITGVVPAVAWMPFALTLLPTPFTAAVFLIVICSWFTIAGLTASGIQSTPKVLFETAKTLGAKTPYLVFKVAIPNAMPQIFTGIVTANGFAFTTLVMAEMMGQPGGLGYYINASKVWSAYYKVFAAIIVMAILFSLIMKAVDLIQGRVLRWRKGLVTQ